MENIKLKNAVNIETAFGDILGISCGQRGQVNDADIFRSGERDALSDLLDETAKQLKISLPKTQKIDLKLNSLLDIAERMKNIGGKDSDLYHWEIIAALLVIIKELKNQ